MATLGEILQLLPDVGRMRLAFNPAFWPRAANSLLSMIEAEARGPELYMEAYIPFNGRQTMFQIPSTMRKLLHVRMPDVNGILNLVTPGSEIPYRVRGEGMIQLLNPPGVTPISVSVTQAIASGTTVTVGTAIAEAIVEGWAAIVTHTTTDDSIEYRRVLSKAEDGLSVELDGTSVKTINIGDNVRFVNQFMIFEGQRRLARFVDEDSESPLPDEWNRILEAGLRWKMEAQSDEEGASDASIQWYQQFIGALESYAGDLSERPGDQNIPIPRGGSHWGIL